MKKKLAPLSLSLLALGLAGALVTACGDNETDDGHGHGGEGGDVSGTGGNGSLGGNAATGGKNSGGEGGAASGTGGQNVGGEGGVIETPEPITKASTQLLTGINDLRGLVYSANGKIYGSGHTDAEAGNRKIVLVRLNADGSFDTSFSEDGIVEFDAAPAGQTEESLGVVELPNGDLLVQANVSDGKGGELIDDANVAEDGENPAADDGARANGTNVVLIKFDSDGDVVTDFGTEGVKLVNFGWTDADDASWPKPTYNSVAKTFSGPGFPGDTSWGLALDPSSTEENPMVVVFGHGPAAKVASGTQRTDNDRYVVRLLASNGSVDPAFNSGKVYSFTTPGTLGDNGRRGIVEADGTIVSSGYTNFTPYGNHIVILRLNKNGSPDTSFTAGGMMPGVSVQNPFLADGGVAEAYGITKQSTGRYVTVGYGQVTGAGLPSSFDYETSQGPDLVSFGLVPGDLDSTYGVQGTLAFQSEALVEKIDNEDRGRDVLALSDDRVVLVGRYGGSGGPAIFVATKNGYPDISVGDEGRFLYEPYAAAPANFYKVALSKDGTQVAASTGNHAAGVFIAILKVGDAP